MAHRVAHGPGPRFCPHPWALVSVIHPVASSPIFHGWIVTTLWEIRNGNCCYVIKLQGTYELKKTVSMCCKHITVKLRKLQKQTIVGWCYSLTKYIQLFLSSAWFQVLEWMQTNFLILMTKLSLRNSFGHKTVLCGKKSVIYTIRYACPNPELGITVRHRKLPDLILNMSGQFHILIGHDVRTFHRHNWILLQHVVYLWNLLR